MYTKRLEASVTYSILTQLENLGWIVDEKNPLNNVTQQRTKTDKEKKKLEGKSPDFVLYEINTNTPIGIIEAKRPDRTLDNVLKEAEEKYAKPLNTPLIFAYNDTYIETRYLYNGRNLKIDGEDVRQFIDHYTALRFVKEGSEILSAPAHIQYSREELIKIFKRASNLLREAGLQAGLERFGAFSDILFLKIMDEICELRLHAKEKPPIPDHIRWSNFKDKKASDLYLYMKDVVWKTMNEKYGSIFSESLPIENQDILKDIIDELSDKQLKLTAADTDIKGDAFEYFLKNAYQGLSIKDLGEYFTPRNIVRTMISIVNPQIGEKIYDPFCGTGGFLIESFKYLRMRMKANSELNKLLKEKTVYGSEITTNARIAKMNMILFGDGHNNIVKEDSFANPKTGKYDIVLTNPPYSQKTRYGNLYPISSTDGDAMAIMHCFDSLNKNGRAAILIKEDFLSEGGGVGDVRRYIMKNAKNFSIISLPRKLFVPYTPTKTNIIYFEKAGKRNSTFFYVINNVGHTLASRKKSIKENDLPLMLDAFNSQEKSQEITSCIVDNDIIKKNDYSLWVYDYIEVYPDSKYKMYYLGKYIEEIDDKIKLSNYPDEKFIILGVNNQIGVFENEIIMGGDIGQKYKKVEEKYLAYNPHRVNVGSIGLVDKETSGGYVPGIYFVFKSINEKVPPEYILHLLKSKPYKKVIEAYDTKYGAVRANLTYNQLCRIKIPILPESILKKFFNKQNILKKVTEEMNKEKNSMTRFIKEITTKDLNPNHKEDFEEILKIATLNEAK